MKVIHLISGGDSGGAKTHVLSLLQNLSKSIDVTMVCFMEGPFAQEARALGIRTEAYPSRNVLKTLPTLKRKIRDEGCALLHCPGARGNMMGAFLRRSPGVPVVPPVHSDYHLDYLGRPFSRLTYGTINTIALRHLDYRIGVSAAMVDLLISRGFGPGTRFTTYHGHAFPPPPPARPRLPGHGRPPPAGAGGGLPPGGRGAGGVGRAAGAQRRAAGGFRRFGRPGR